MFQVICNNRVVFESTDSEEAFAFAIGYDGSQVRERKGLPQEIVLVIQYRINFKLNIQGGDLYVPVQGIEIIGMGAFPFPF